MDNYSDMLEKMQDNYFREFYRNIFNSCDKNEIKKFCSDTNIDTDFKRFKFVSEFKAIKNYHCDFDDAMCKDNIIAIGLKVRGNFTFQNNDMYKALYYYNQALMITPMEDAEDFALISANRAAVFFHLKKYHLAIKDIEMATLNYPKWKMYKIKERLAKCYLNIGDFYNSLNAYKEVIGCLHESSLPNDKRIQLENEAQIMVKDLEAKMELEPIDESSKLAIIEDAQNILNESVGFEYSPSEGYYAKASNEIKIGDSILVEKPHCAVLLEEHTQTHCQHCFLSTMAPVVCPNCAIVVFCSKECRDIALSTYHAYECKLLPLIWLAGFPNQMHMALRMISQKPLQYFIDIKDQLTDKLKVEDTLKLSFDDYRTIFTLVRHENIREPQNFLHESTMANILTYYLQKVNYFSSLNTNDNQFTEMYAFIGGLILRNIQILKYNVHAVSELEHLNGRRKLIKIGDAIYPNLTRFNHSCNPSILKYFQGTSVNVRASKTIKPGEQIFENYGFMYTQQPYDERQHKLRDIFHFNCICIPCTELWPMCREMDYSKFKFKCAAGGDTKCENILILTENCLKSKQTVNCNKCNQFTNISNGKEDVQKMEMCLITANQFLECGELQKAAEKYCEGLKMMEDYLVIPCTNYCAAQQMYYECLMEHGNKTSF